MNAELQDRVEQIVRCVEEIHRCEREFPDHTGCGAELGYYDWLDELHYQVKERGMSRRVFCDRVPYEHEENYNGMPCINPRAAEEFLPPSKNHKPGIGGAPTRATTLPTEPAERKKFPVASGFMDYFPDAIAAVSNLSYIGNEQHNPGQPLHWARGKSTDEADTMMRHFLQRGTLDTDGARHSVKMVWRALAFLQKEIEQEAEQNMSCCE